MGYSDTFLDVATGAGRELGADEVIDKSSESLWPAAHRHAQGAIVPPPVETYRFEDVASAHRAIESGRTVGKLVLTV